MSKAMLRALKNNVMKYDDAERRIREATSNEPDFCGTDLMMQIADDILDPARYKSTMDMLNKRLQDFAHLNHVLKSLILIEFLLRHAEDHFVQDMKDKIALFKKLRGYKYFDQAQKDVGGDTRKWATAIVNLLENMEELQKRRHAAKKNREEIKHEVEQEPEEEEEEKPKEKQEEESDQEDEHDEDEEEEVEEKPKRKTKKKTNKSPHKADEEDEEQENIQDKAASKKKSEDDFLVALEEMNPEKENPPAAAANQKIKNEQLDFLFQ